MTNSTPHISPQEVFAAGSLVDVPVSAEQAEAVSARAETFARPASPYLGLYSWRIPSANARMTGASIESGELEVHFLYLPDQPFDFANPDTGLEVVGYDGDGVERTTQDHGVQRDA